MSQKSVIRKGDTTSHGGVVLEGIDNYPVMGTPVACKGHMVSCPKCKGTYPIIQGVSSFSVGGELPAVEGMVTGCGAELIATQSQFTLEFVSNAMLNPGVLVASNSFVDLPKFYDSDIEYLEVIVGENIGIVPASIFGHSAIEIDNVVYSRAHEKYAVINKNKYINGGEPLANGRVSAGQRGTRQSYGLVLWVTAAEKKIILQELKRRVSVDEEFRAQNPSETSYSLTNNSCSTNVADVLEMIGVMAHDPRGFSTPVSPKELLTVIRRSRRLVKEVNYPKVTM